MTTEPKKRTRASQARDRLHAVQQGGAPGGSGVDLGPPGPAGGVPGFDNPAPGAAPDDWAPQGGALETVDTPAVPLPPAGEGPYPTGIDIPADLHQKVQRAAGGHGQVQVRQTEVLLAAFEAVYPKIPGLVAAYKTRQQVESPLFGQRVVQKTVHRSAMKRWQVRPTMTQYRTLRKLAADHGVSLAELTRLVLAEHFKSPRGRQQPPPASEDA
jgi:hypothetical protein